MRRAFKAQREKWQTEAAQLRSQVMTPDELQAQKQETRRTIEAARQIDLTNASTELKSKLFRLLVDEITLDANQGEFKIQGPVGAFSFVSKPLK